MKLHVYPNRRGKHGRKHSSVKIAKIYNFGIFFIAGFLLFLTQSASAQISGTVYRDFNANGLRDTQDVGVGGVVITIYNNNGTSVGTATTSSTGAYAVTPSPNTGPFRVEFTNLPAGYFSGPRGNQSGTTVQFVSTSSSTINLGINDPDQYCQDNPAVITPCYVNGDPTKVGSAATDPAIVSFPYSASGIKGSGGTAVIGATLANASGPTWGMAYDKFNNVLYSGAVVRRHSGFGPLGVGGIYKTTNPGTNTIATSNFVNLEAAPYNIDFGTLTNASRNLPANKPDPSADAAAFDAVGKQGIGDMDISEDGKTLYLINLFDRKLYRINNINTGTAPVATDISSFTISDPNTAACSNSLNFRPWALKFYNGRLYVGAVCSGEASPGNTTADLRALIYEFNPSTGTFSLKFSFPLNYARGLVDNSCSGTANKNWNPWVSTFGTRGCSSIIIYPQPIFSDIEFDVDGSMILGFIDRNASQIGNLNFDTNGAGEYQTIGGGEILRAYPSGSTWVLESGGDKDGPGPYAATADQNTGENKGPGGGEFYWGDRWTFNGNDYHGETSNGGIGFRPGSGQVLMSATNPDEGSIWAGGVKWLSNDNGSAVKGYALYNNASDRSSGAFGKANGIGDVEVLCGIAPIEIGNRIWNDTDFDGLQDANETGISGVTVELFRNGVKVGQTTTNTAGEYYFNNSTVNLNGATGLLPNVAYEIRVSVTQATLSSLDLTTNNRGTNDGIDSDATLQNGNAVIALTTGPYGDNNHTYDIGFRGCPTIAVVGNAARSICEGETIAISASTNATNPPYTAIEFYRFDTQQSNPYTATGNGKTRLDEFALTVGQTIATTGSISTSNFPAGATDKTYYVYACVKPVPGSPVCIPRAEYIIVVKPRPRPNPTGSDVCEGQTLQLSASDGGLYSWAGPSGFTSAVQNPTRTGATTAMSGVYSVTVTGTNGCTTSAFTNPSITVKPRPVVSASGNTICIGGTILLSATGGGSYSWLGPAAETPQFTSTAQNPSRSGATLAMAGVYSVTVTGTNACTASSTASVVVNTQGATASAPAVCEGETLNLSTSGGTSYSWRGPTTETPQFTSTTQNPTRPNATLAMAGIYTVTVGGSNGCTGTATVSAVIRSKPVVNASGGNVCEGATISLSASGGGTYSWAGPAAFSNTSAAPTRVNATTAMAGVYSVTVTGTNSCTNSATASVSVFNRPTISTVGDEVCEGETIQLSASGGNTYTWAGPGGFTASGANPSRVNATASMAGVYSVTTTANGNTCTSSATTSVVVKAKPTANATLICNGQGTAVSPTNPALGFNVFVQNNARFTTSESEGGVAVGGNPHTI